MNQIAKTNLLILNWIVAANDRPKIDFAVGGQAVVEGVMMRAPNNITIAVRKQDNSIAVRVKPYRTLTQRYKFLNIPILRGVINLFEMMIIGTEAINYSAEQAFDEEPEKIKNPSRARKVFDGAMFIFSFIIAMGISLALFKFAPLAITTFLETYFQAIQDNYILFNFIDGLLKMSIFLAYIYILSLFPSFRRIFEYHGAEHKAIWNYEVKQPLTPDNAAKMTRFHPRCGTSFIIIVFVISIIFYTFIPKQDTFLANFALRIAVLPLIAGISYEFLKFSARHTEQAFVKILIQPGLWFQRLTTREPDIPQLEVSLKSLEESLKMQMGEGGV
ncbi:DUF1385 domain-containing protein [Candidatus Gracilibacteria bacterium]|nr:DUF1385 domain-containing protein [Candidatus Gracilibacteria bacterium]